MDGLQFAIPWGFLEYRKKTLVSLESEARGKKSRAIRKNQGLHERFGISPLSMAAVSTVPRISQTVAQALHSKV